MSCAPRRPAARSDAAAAATRSSSEDETRQRGRQQVRTAERTSQRSLQTKCGCRLFGQPECRLHTRADPTQTAGARPRVRQHQAHSLTAVRRTPNTFLADVRRNDALDRDVVVLEHRDVEGTSAVVAEIAPTFGSNLYRLSVGGAELLRGDVERLRQGLWSGTLVLWPLPNRVRDKRYEFLGRVVDLAGVVRPEGDAPLIHGLVDDLAWDHETPRVSRTAASVRTSVELTPESRVFTHYPYPSR